MILRRRASAPSPASPRGAERQDGGWLSGLGHGERSPQNNPSLLPLGAPTPRPSSLLASSSRGGSVASSFQSGRPSRRSSFAGETGAASWFVEGMVPRWGGASSRRWWSRYEGWFDFLTRDLPLVLGVVGGFLHWLVVQPLLDFLHASDDTASAPWFGLLFRAFGVRVLWVMVKVGRNWSENAVGHGEDTLDVYSMDYGGFRWIMGEWGGRDRRRRTIVRQGTIVLLSRTTLRIHFAESRDRRSQRGSG